MVLYREGDYLGGTVNLAARLLGLAGRGELLASGPFRAPPPTDFEWDFEWESRGSQHIRGFGAPVGAYRLRSICRA